MIHINQKRYSLKSEFRAVYQSERPGAPDSAVIAHAATGGTAAALAVGESESVPGWKDRYFTRLSLKHSLAPGRYRIIVTKDGAEEHSENFSLADERISEKDLSDLLVYFKTMRCDGLYDEADSQAPVWGSDERRDVSGGWYDASGDTSKYLSHLSYAGRMSPQQTPLVVWVLADVLRRYDDASLWTGTNFRRWVQFEMNHGADFLIKMQHEEGWFYKTLFDRWSKDPEERMLCSYKTQEGLRLKEMKAGFREGGGMACAALAAAATHSDGERRKKYLDAAVAGYVYLREHNEMMLEGGAPNLIDDVCALAAAVRLYEATGLQSYKEDLSFYINSMAGKFHNFDETHGWWTVDGEHPYYHASDEGLPLIVLMQAERVDCPDTKKTTQHMLQKAFSFLEETLLKDPDPFHYPRHWCDGKDQPRLQWFYPHDNPSGYWWQGENSRISSLGAAALYGESQRHGQSGASIALAAADWQLGVNPFNLCMVDGWGVSSPVYEGDYYNLPGGVLNGITSGFDDEGDIAFQPELPGNPGDNAWRWGEQWIPHAAWFFLLSSLIREKGL